MHRKSVDGRDQHGLPESKSMRCFMTRRGRRQVGKFAAYGCQMEMLRLKPLQNAPMEINGIEAVWQLASPGILGISQRRNCYTAC